MKVSKKKVGQNMDVKFLAPQSDMWQIVSLQNATDETERETAKRSAQQLKDSLLASLQMQNLVVLAGCGTSLGDVGGPSMQDLWNLCMLTSPATPISTETQSIVTKVAYSATDTNIEQFLTHCDAYLQIYNDNSISDFVAECKKKILDRCSSFLDDCHLESHRVFLHRLSRRRIRDPRLKVFTTNYDLCFERAAGGLGIVVIDGFSYTQPRYYDPRFFNYDIVRRPRNNEDSGNYLEGVFQLFKLHGSVNWRRVENDRIVEGNSASTEKNQPCLIFPAKGKYQQTYIQPHLELISQYLSALREPNTCLIVTGFGFNDDHLAAPILSAIQSNPHMRLIIVDTNAEGCCATGNSHWKTLHALSQKGEDIWFVNASFGEFSKMIPDLKSLTPADKLVKDIKNLVGGQ